MCTNTRDSTKLRTGPDNRIHITIIAIITFSNKHSSMHKIWHNISPRAHNIYREVLISPTFSALQF